MTDPIKIEGLKEFTSQLRRLSSDLPKALRIAFNEAADIIVDDAKADVPSLSGRARRSVKSRSTRTSARVQGGSKAVPYYPWLDFGGKVGRNRSVSRPFLPRGRYIYPAFFSNRAKFVTALGEGLTTVAASAGLEMDRG